MPITRVHTTRIRLHLRQLILCLGLWAGLSTWAAWADTPSVLPEVYKNEGVILLQPEAQMRQILPAQNPVSQFASYLQTLEQSLKGFFTAQPPNSLPASSGFIVFALKPEGTPRLWLDMEPALPDNLAQQLHTTIRQLPHPPIQLREKILVFAFQISLKGAIMPKPRLPFPSEWQALLQNQSEAHTAEELAARTW